MRWRLFFLLALIGLLSAPLLACGTTQRVVTPVLEPLIPAGIFRLPADQGDRFLVLTIDDAPSSRTKEISEILARHGAHATFFVHTGQITAETRPHLAAAIAAGHELGSHLVEDRSAYAMSRDEFETAFAAAHHQLETFGSGARAYFRPPQGLFRPHRMDPVLEAYGYDRPLAVLGSEGRYVMASFIPWDAGGNKTNTDDPALNRRRGERYAGQLVANLYPGAIVVFHDGEADGREARLTTTLSSLDLFLTAAIAAEYEIVTLTEGIERSAARQRP